MKKPVLKLLAVAVLAMSAFGAYAADANVTSNVIMGTGIANGGFTVNTARGVEVGLRARERYDLVTNQPSNVTGSNNDGTYNQNAGEPPGFGSSNRARWNFDWSINTGTAPVNTYTYLLGMDFDASFGTSFQSFDPINLALADHSFGTNSTAQSAGVEATNAAGYATLVGANNLVQNSWNYDFFDSVTFPFDPNANGNYSIFLQVLDAGGLTVAQSNIEVIVGTGFVPEPGSLALVGLALTGLAVSRRRKLTK